MTNLISRIVALAGLPETSADDRNIAELETDLIDLDDASMIVLRGKMRLYGNGRIEGAQNGHPLRTYIYSLSDLARKHQRIEQHLLQKIRADSPMTKDDADFLLEQLTDLRNLALITQAVVLRLEERARSGKGTS